MPYATDSFYIFTESTNEIPHVALLNTHTRMHTSALAVSTWHGGSSRAEKLMAVLVTIATLNGWDKRRVSSLQTAEFLSDDNNNSKQSNHPLL